MMSTEPKQMKLEIVCGNPYKPQGLRLYIVRNICDTSGPLNDRKTVYGPTSRANAEAFVAGVAFARDESAVID